MLLDGATVAYTTVTAAPEGTPFHIIAEKLPSSRLRRQAGPAGELPVVQVDLVNGAVVWYTAEREFEYQPGEPPGRGMKDAHGHTNASEYSCPSRS